LALVDDGYSFRRAAEEIPCAPSSVKRWFDSRATAGSRRPQLGPGPRRTLTQKERTWLARRLKTRRTRVAQAINWTSSSVVALIEKQFGVTYSRSHVVRLLREFRFRYVKPMPRAIAADPAKAKKWMIFHDSRPRGGWYPRR
jgi:transposase